MVSVGLFWLSLAFVAQEGFSLPIFPPPWQTEVFTSSWQFHLPVKVDAPSVLQRPAELLKSELRRLFGENAVSNEGKTVIYLNLTPSLLPREEEYPIDATSPCIFIPSHDLQGTYWAVHSLLQVLSSDIIVPNSRRLLVREWANPKPDVIVKSVQFIPNFYGLALGIKILGVTAEVQ